MRFGIGRRSVAVALAHQLGREAACNVGNGIDAGDALLDDAAQDVATAGFGFALLRVGYAGVGVGNLRGKFITQAFGFQQGALIVGNLGFVRA